MNNNDCVRLASEHLTDLVEETKKTADFFRYEDESEANQRLVILIEAFQKFVGILDLLKETLTRDSSLIAVDKKSLAELQPSMTDAFHQILEAQGQQDWIALADLLEHTLAPILAAWARFIPTLDRPPSSP